MVHILLECFPVCNESIFHFGIEFYKDVTDIFVNTFKVPNTRLLFCLKIYFVVGVWASDVCRDDYIRFQHFLSRL